MNWMKFRNGFGFDDHYLLDENIETVREVDPVALVNNRKWHFLSHGETSASKFKCEALRVSALE